MFVKYSISVFLVWFICLSGEVFARPTKAEKSSRRSEYWGLYADLYRARTCFAYDQIDRPCIDHAILHAKHHARNLDRILPEQDKFSNELQKLEENIHNAVNHAATESIEMLLMKLSQEFSSSIAPVVQPALDKGETIYKEFCHSCHGDGVGSKGSLSDKLQKKPRPFNVIGRFETLTPFGVYAVMIHGIENSEMTSMLDVLDVDELWAVAFYVINLQSPTIINLVDSDLESALVANKEAFALSNLAVATNKDLVEKLKLSAVNCEKCIEQIAYIRKNWIRDSSAVRLGQSAQTPVQKTESRALKLLMLVISVVSFGFYFVLRRRSRIK